MMDQKKFTTQLGAKSKFFHSAFANPCTMQKKDLFIRKTAAGAVSAFGNYSGN